MNSTSHSHPSPILGDGAIGTMLIPRLEVGERVEDAAVVRPDLVVDVHRAYLDAGSRRLHTASFLACARASAKRQQIYRASADCLRQAADGTDVELGLTIGPLASEARELWGDLERALELGFGHVLCSTITSLRSAELFVSAWQDVIVRGGVSMQGTLSCSVQPSREPDGWDWVAKVPAADQLTLGLNCSEGPAGLRPAAEAIAERWEAVHLAPSAGLPDREGRHIEPEPWAAAVLALADGLPVTSLGGCCGTTPEHIGALLGA